LVTQTWETEDPPETFDSGPSREILFKIGVNISGEFYLASFLKGTSEDTAVLLLLENPNTLERYTTDIMDDFDEQTAKDVLRKLKINRETSTVEVSYDKKPIIYKRSHFISNRYFIITIIQEFSGLHFSALEPDRKQTLGLTLNRKSNLLSKENMHIELSKIIRNLEIFQFLGEECLILNAKTT
jgi:hypothetical protein